MPTSRLCNGCQKPIPADAPEGLCANCLDKAGPVNEPGVSRAGTVAVTETQILGSADRSDPAALEGGKPFGGYRILRLLGKGGMGAVYEAEEIESGRRVALKVLNQALDSPQARQRFLREGRLAASVNHPNSVYVFGTEEIEDQPVITMELVTGGTLQQRVKQKGPMPVAEAVDAILQIVAGLEAAAAVGVLHRDVKPSNCFVETDGAIKVGDFGLSISSAVREETKLTMTGMVLGTPAFSSPEQLRGDEMTVRSDIYAVGVTLYYLLTGQVPFECENLVRLLATVLERPAESPAKWRKEIPKGLCRVVLRCLEKQPLARFKDYAELRAALLPYNLTAPTPATLPLRLLAGLIDSLLISALVMPLTIFAGLPSTERPLSAEVLQTSVSFSFTLLNLFYYALLEGIWGASLGKRLCGLRVVGPNRGSPGVSRALLRAVIVELLPALPLIVFTWISFLPHPSNAGGLKVVGISFSNYLIIGLLFSTVRRRNGFAAVHDLITRTRVILKSAYLTRPSLAPTEPDPALPEISSKVGPYGFLEVLDKKGAEEVLLGYDTRLLRKVWIRRVPIGAQPVAPSLRNLARVGRLRWLNGKRSPQESWDAYEAVPGKPFLRVIANRQPWGKVRFWLLDLAEEITAALKDQSLPEVLAFDRIWITADGRAKLLDFPAAGVDARPTSTDVLPDELGQPTEQSSAVGGRPEPFGETATGTTSTSGSPAPPDPRTPQIFLKQAAVAALAGRIVTASEARPAAIAAPLPLHARDLLAELDAGLSAKLLTDRLKPLLNRVALVSRWRRVALAAGCSAFAVFTIGISLVTFGFITISLRLHPEATALSRCLSELSLLKAMHNLPSGLDSGGAAYSGDLLGPSRTWNGIAFNLGPTNAADAVSGVGQELTLPAGKFTELRMLATAVYGNRTSQTFVLTYTDNTTRAFTQSLSDWFTPQDFPGEFRVLSMAHRNLSNGTNDNRDFYVYGYAFNLESNKTVKTLTFPTNPAVVVLAITLGPPATPVDLSLDFNVTDGIVAEGSTFYLEPHLRDAFETYISGLYGQTITNPATWGTLAATLTTQDQRNLAEQIIAAHPRPTETELKQATHLVEWWRQKAPVIGLTAGTSMFFDPVFLFNFFNMVFVISNAIPGLLAALLFRGGLISRLLSVAVVKKDGTDASRLRIFWRSILTWSPFLALALVSLRPALLPHFLKGSLLVWIAPVTVATLVTWSILLRERGLQDRLAGTCLVPR